MLLFSQDKIMSRFEDLWFAWKAIAGNKIQTEKLEVSNRYPLA
jgi:hypothetical protein